MRIAYKAGNVLQRPYANFAWEAMTYGNVIVFGLPLLLTVNALYTESPSLAVNALALWYNLYEVGYSYLFFTVTLLFAVMMYSSWNYYLVSDAIDVARVGYAMFAQAERDLLLYWASQAIFHHFVMSHGRKTTFRKILVSLDVIALGPETESETDGSDSSDEPTDFNQDGNQPISF